MMLQGGAFMVQGAAAEAIAPVFRSSSKAAGTVIGSISVAKPVGVVNGDYLYMVVTNNAEQDATIETPAGWEEIYNLPIDGSSQDNAAVFRRQASGEPSSWSVSFSVAAGAGTLASVVVIAIEGGTGYLRHGTSGGGSSGSGNPPEQTVDNDDSLSIICAHAVRGNEDPLTMIMPSGYTEAEDAPAQYSDGSISISVGNGAGYKSSVPAGGENPSGISFSNICDHIVSTIIHDR